MGAVTFNHGKWLEYYGRMIERSAPFPPPPPGYDQPEDMRADAGPTSRSAACPTGIPDVVLTGHDPTERGAEFRPGRRARLIQSERHGALVMTPETAWAEAMRYENRANPFPFFDELRKTPVARVGDDLYVVTGYWELHKLLHDPRLSSDAKRSPLLSGRSRAATAGADDIEVYAPKLSFIATDPPDHDRMRRQVHAAIRSSTLAGPHPEHGARHSAAL